MTKTKSKRPKSTSGHSFEATFVRHLARVPRHARPSLLTWLRRWRRRPQRVFLFVDEE